MGCRAFILLGLLVAAALLTSSEVGARDLAETSTEKKKAELSKETDDTRFENQAGGYGENPRGYGNAPPIPGYGGYPPRGYGGYAPPYGGYGGYAPPYGGYGGYAPPYGGYGGYVPPRGG